MPRAQSAESKGEAGWRFTLQAPSYVAVMTYLDDAAIREQIYRAYVTRATERRARQPAAHRPNSGTAPRKGRAARLRRFRRLRARRPHGPHRRARRRSSSTDLKDKTEAAFRAENAELRSLRRAASWQPWDIGYYAEKQRKALYDFDEEELRPYFPLERVVEGMFEIVERLYGIAGGARRPACRCGTRMSSYYEIRDERRPRCSARSTPTGIPRENKRGGAWMDAFITGVACRRREPHVGLHLRQPDAAGRRTSPRCSRTAKWRPSSTSSVICCITAEPRGSAQPGRHRRGVGFRRAALADHGELVLGARGARSVRAPLRDRRAHSRRSVSRR